MSLKSEIINHLEAIADLLEFNSDNPFKIKAFKFGSNAIRQFDGDLENAILSAELKNIKGIGKAIIQVITEFYDNGTSTEYEKLSDQVPDGIQEIFEIRGLGVKRIRKLNEELGITSIAELETAAKENKVANISGFGENTQEKILTEIKRIKENRGFLQIHKSSAIADEISAFFKSSSVVEKFEVTGELRRGLEKIKCVEFVVSFSDYKYLIKKLNEKLKLVLKNNEQEIIVIENLYQIPVIFYITKNESDFTKKLFLSTGSNEYLGAYKFKLNIEFRDEKEIYKNSNIDFLIPEMRELDFVNAPYKLKTNSDLSIEKFKGLLHFHSTYSDGHNKIEETVKAGKEMGYQYFVVCDHSKSAYYANGLNEERILLQKKEIIQFNSKYNNAIYQGIESDILKDGSLDYPEEILQQFDLVVASVHSSFELSESEMTNRIIKAIENPYTDILGHPTGRLILVRDGYKVNMKKIIDACSQNQVAIELNSSPYRLDIDWRWIYYAREKGCLISINQDAHSIDDLQNIEFGIKMARKAGLQTEETLNCFEFEKFKNYLSRKVNRKIK
ncbi:MAG: hypothetical protein JW866_11240 [Ignavibacteriales bacterium]|nr:hypothetical protein [Ignavibacteriales bacterium]